VPSLDTSKVAVTGSVRLVYRRVVVHVRVAGNDLQLNITGTYSVSSDCILRLNPRTVREYVQRGEIEGRIIGGRWRFRRADLDAFFANAPRNWDFAGKNNQGD
jgi:excisionase family DNA binding protein